MYFLILFQVLAMTDSAEPILIGNLEIYEPLFPSHVAIAPDGTLFVLDKANHRFLRVGPDGKREYLSGKGQGPGELNRPYTLRIIGDTILVQDRSISLFDLKGNFQRRLNSGKAFGLLPVGPYLIKASHNADKAGRLIRYDYKFKEETIYEWAYNRVQTPPKRYEFGVAVAGYNPAPEHPLYQVDSTRNMVFIAHMGRKAKVSAVQVETGEVSQFFLPLSPLPMNENWGRTKMEGLGKDNKGFRVELEEQDYFPIFRNFWLGPKGELVFSLWTGQPDQREHFFVCDAQGREIDLGFDPALMRRLAGIHNGYAWLCAWDEGDGAYLVGCAENQLGAIAKKHHWVPHVKPADTFILLK